MKRDLLKLSQEENLNLKIEKKKEFEKRVLECLLAN